MQTNSLDSPRQFQIWSYTVGHGQLLLRSTKTTDFSTRIDVLFKDVGAIHLPMTLDGLALTEATEDEKVELRPQIASPRLRDRKVFVVSGSNFTGYVVAGMVAWHEDDLEYYDPSYFSFSLTPGGE